MNDHERLSGQLADLTRRRDELAAQVAREQSDLGGLTYEMAARDHFRLDVLVARAAVLQEHDMELAELDRKLAALKGAAGATGGAGTASAAGLGTAGLGAAGPAKGRSLTPWAVLAPLFLAFGIGIGWAVSGPASRAAEVRLVSETPPVSTTATTATTLTTHSTSRSSAAKPGGGHRAAATSSSTTSTSATATSSTPASSGQGSTGSTGSTGAANGPATKLPPIKHVFVIMLADEPYAAVFGPESKATYLAHTLEHKGELLVHFDAVAHEDLAGEIALISGQGPTEETAANCANYTSITPAAGGPNEQVIGQGCVYPKLTETLGSQLTAKHLTWRAYIEDGGGCTHPALGTPDPSSAAGSTILSPTYLDPFLYFDSVIGSQLCGSENATVTRLAGDLENESTTPNFSYIVPDRCHDASPNPCSPGVLAGPADADSFLESVVPKILASPAYRNNGLLVITVDNAPATGQYADSSSCCGQPQFPDLPASTGPAGSARGGGQVGALLLSPYVKAVAAEHEELPANTFSLLATFEDFFSLGHLGYAGTSGASALAPSLFTASPQAG